MKLFLQYSFLMLFIATPLFSNITFGVVNGFFNAYNAEQNYNDYNAVVLENDPELQVRIERGVYQHDETFDFGTTMGSATVSLELRNVGDEDLVVSDYEISGDEFSVDGDLTGTLVPSQTESFDLHYQSSSVGETKGSLTLVSNDPENEEYTVHLVAETLDPEQPITIAEAREMDEGELVTITGWVTVSNQFMGPVFIQDETAGIAWYDGNIMGDNWSIDAIIGDSIVVSGEIGDFYNLVQIVGETSYEVFPEANREIETKDITLEDLNTGIYEGELVQISNLEFEDSGTFSGGTNYDVTDQSGQGELRVDNYTNIHGTSIPSAPTDVTGVAGVFRETHQIIPRFTDDIEVLIGPVIISTAPYEIFATSGSITFEWETQHEGHSEVRYGTTSSLDMGEVIDESPKTEHNITINNLDPASIYKVQLRSADTENDTSATGIYTTSTTSPEGTTGEIDVYFNKDVAHELATYQEAEQNVDFGQKHIELIQEAEETIEYAIYNISQNAGDDIADALIAADNSGVEVRVIGSGHGSSNNVINHLAASGVNAVHSTGDEQMHNKFLIIDANHDDPAKPHLVTSSWNATDHGIESQFNNMLIIQDVALARAYLQEFNQMWGGEYGEFNANESLFSYNKAVVNPSVFWIGEDQTKVELYFSPQGNTESQINRTLSTAEASIDLALMAITRRPISNTMRNRHINDVKVRGTIANINITGSEWEYLSEWADVHHFSESELGLLHHKYAIVDGEDGNLDSKVITGSHNWSANANFNNDENTLILHDSRIANEYFQEFGARYWQAGGEDEFDVTINIENDMTEISDEATLYQNYPNPFADNTNIKFELTSDKKVTLQVHDITGRVVKTLINDQKMNAGTHTVNIDASQTQTGIYIYRIQLNDGQSFSRKMQIIK